MKFKRKYDFIKKRRRKKFGKKQKFSKINLFKVLIIIFLSVVFYKMNKIENKYRYFCCFVSKGKSENRYVRELVEHYISIGVEKLYLGDDNYLGTEKFSDVIQDYIDKKIVEVYNTRKLKYCQTDFFNYILEKAKYTCNWLMFYDFDEFLEFTDKNMTIKDYLSKDEFNKCDVVKTHWLMFYDNDIVYYDNRTLKERFNKPDYHSKFNKYIKSIVRGKQYNGTIWVDQLGTHQPNESLVTRCDEVGNIVNVPHGILVSPNYKYTYIRHHTMKSAEEFTRKLIRGGDKEEKFNYTQRIKEFFEYNKFTKEKLAVFEKTLNMTFPLFHTKEYE